MASKSGQKETPGPLNCKQSRKGSRGQQRQVVCVRPTDQTNFLENSKFRFDPCRIRVQPSCSKPAGPLLQNTLSLGGSFFSRKEDSP